MLRVENISTGYGKKQVLFNVSFEVNKGEIALLAGSNGSGKSTLLKVIYMILPQWNNGLIFLDTEDITVNSTSSLVKKGLLYIPQKNNLFEELTVKENLQIAGQTLGPTLLKQRIENALSTFPEIVPYMDRIPMKLSGGQRKLLTLTMALLHQPKMILLDEPFTGLSSQNILFIADILKSLNDKNMITMLIVEHRVKECLRIATAVIGLKLGKICLQEKVNSTFNIDQLKSVFV